MQVCAEQVEGRSVGFRITRLASAALEANPHRFHDAALTKIAFDRRQVDNHLVHTSRTGQSRWFGARSDVGGGYP